MLSLSWPQRGQQSKKEGKEKKMLDASTVLKEISFKLY